MLLASLTVVWLTSLGPVQGTDVVDAAVPRLEIASPVIAADGPVLRIRCVGDPSDAGALSSVGVRVAGRWFAVGSMEPGAETRLELGAALFADSGDTHSRVPVTLCYTQGGDESVIESSVILAREPESAVPPGAIAKVVAHNTSSTAEDDTYVMALVPGVAADPSALCVRSAGSDLVPALIERTGGGLVVHALADIPADYARCLYVCTGAERAPVCDLTVESQDLGSGAGWVRVATERYSLTLSEQAGACVTELVSKSTGLDYAARSFGGSLGATDAPESAREEVANQPGLLRVEAGSTGAAVARVVAVGWAGTVRIERTYTFVAGKPWFLLRSRVDADGLDGEEVCLVEARLRSNGLTDIVSIGRRSEDSEPGRDRHAEGVPAVVTFVEAPGRRAREGWSIGVLGGRGLSGARYDRQVDALVGADTESCVQAELLADPSLTDGGSVSASCVVLLHGGGLPEARSSIEALRTPRFVTARPLG